MRCETSIIRKALKTLPKTLDETYERILLALPEQSRTFVRYAFLWMHFNSLLDATRLSGFVDFGNMSCACLLQAIESSLAALGVYSQGKICDREALREHCGCLIDIRREWKPIASAEDTSPEYGMFETVAFAHYTVLEYLTSSRVSSGLATEFFISNDSHSMQLLNNVLLAAPHGQYDCTRWEVEKEKWWDNFALYAVAAIEVVLFDRPQWFPQRPTCPVDKGWTLVADSVIHLVSSESIFLAACRGARNHIHATDRSKSVSYRNEVWYCGLDDQWVDTPSFRLLSLALMCCEQYPDIVEYYVGGVDLASIFKSQHTLSLTLPGYFPNEPKSEYQQYELNCSFIEIFAQLACYQFEYLDILLTLGSGMYDPSKVLVAHVGSHFQCESCIPEQGDSCIIKRLLEEGADPNGSGHWVTPLQIAVCTYQHAVVAQLLTAGADPNRTGDRECLKWEGNTILERFTHLHGHSPVDLMGSGIQVEWDGQFTFGKGRINKRKKANEQMLQLLLRYGARAFCVDEVSAQATHSNSKSKRSGLPIREETFDGNTCDIQSTGDIVMQDNDTEDNLYSA